MLKLIGTKSFQNEKISQNYQTENQFDSDAKIETSTSRKVFSPEEIESFLISNALLMFFAGFDTSSNGMAVTR
jgi:hypothetical protein